MSQNIDYSKGIYDARQLGAGRMLILGVQHMFAMFGATVLVPQVPRPIVGNSTPLTSFICSIIIPAHLLQSHVASFHNYH